MELTAPPLLPPLLLLSGPPLHTPPSPQALPTSAGRQYTPDTIVQTPQSTVAIDPPGWPVEHVAWTHVAPPAQGCPIWARGHCGSAAAGPATTRPTAQTSDASARVLHCAFPPSVPIALTLRPGLARNKPKVGRRTLFVRALRRGRPRGRRRARRRRGRPTRERAAARRGRGRRPRGAAATAR